MKTHTNAGQFNLRGKQYKVLRCGCCVVEDKRYQFRKREHKQEMQAEFRHSTAHEKAALS